MKENIKILSAMAKIFASKDKPALNGVLIEKSEGCTFYVATDGKSLLAYRHDEETCGNARYVIPRDKIEKLKFTRYSNEYAEITCNDNVIELKYNGVSQTFTSNKQDYPDWRRVMPDTGYEVTPAAYSFAEIKNFYDFAKLLGLERNASSFTPIPNGFDKPGIVNVIPSKCVGIVMPNLKFDLDSNVHDFWSLNKQ